MIAPSDNISQHAVDTDFTTLDVNQKSAFGVRDLESGHKKHRILYLLVRVKCQFIMPSTFDLGIGDGSGQFFMAPSYGFRSVGSFSDCELTAHRNQLACLCDDRFEQHRIWNDCILLPERHPGWFKRTQPGKKERQKVRSDTGGYGRFQGDFTTCEFHNALDATLYGGLLRPVVHQLHMPRRHSMRIVNLYECRLEVHLDFLAHICLSKSELQHLHRLATRRKLTIHSKEDVSHLWQRAFIIKDPRATFLH